MKMKLIFLILGTLMFGLIGQANYKAKAASVNLIANPSVEQGTGLPDGWQNSSWGTNKPTYTYLTNDGYGGTRSVYVKMTQFTDGDAKWFFSPVTIKPNAQYYFSDYYKASISSETVVEITDTTGNVSYLWLGTNNKSTTWKLSEYVFTTPSNADKITVLHLIGGVGYLQTDNFVLREGNSATITNGVPNASLEQTGDLTTNAPLEWTNSSWGTNGTQFTYVKSGHTGSRSVKTQITYYSSGDAKWYYTPQPVVAGQYYEFSDYYKSTLTSSVVVMVNNSDGTQSYISLKQAPTSTTNWAKYSDKFTMPAIAVSATVFHLIAAVGWVQTDDYSMLPATVVGFNRGLVSLTFDDGWGSANTNGLPLLQKYGVSPTLYLVTSFLNQPDYMTDSQVKQFISSGAEIGSHTVSHSDLTTLTVSQLNAELKNSKQTLQSKFGGTVNDFATPYGAYNSQVLSAIKQNYRSHRGVEEGYNSKDNFDIYNIKVQNMTSTTTMAEVNGWIAKAAQDKTWLVLVYHQVDNSGSEYSTTPQNLENQLISIKNSGLTAVTMNQAINEILPQISK